MSTLETTTEKGTKVIITPVEPAATADAAKLAVPPTNAQIESTLQEAKGVLEEEKSHLNKKGKKLVEDTQKIIDSTSNLIKDKNRDEKIQKLYLLSKGLVELGATDTIKDMASYLYSKTAETGEELKSQAQDIYEYLRETIVNLITSSEFRSLSSDLLSILKSMSVEKIKEQAKKEGEALSDLASKMPASEDELLESIRNTATQFLQKIGNKKDFQLALKNFFKYSKEISQYLQDVSENASDEVKKFRRLYEDAMDVLSDFVGQKELEEFREDFSDFISKFTTDKKLGPWLKDIREYVLEIMEKPALLNTDDAKKKINDLISRGRKVLQTKKWRDSINSLYDQMNAMFDKIKADQVTLDFGRSLQELGKDFALNKKGYPDLLVIEDSVTQIKELLVPIFKKQLSNLPVKKIEVYSDNYDVVLEDLLVSGPGFIPEKLELHMTNDSVLNFEKTKEDKMTHKMEIQVNNIKPEFKDMKFHYKKKSFPTIEDFGKADLTVTGKGLNMKVVWTIESEAGKQPISTLTEVSVNIDSLNIRIIGAETKHEILDTLLAPLVSSLLKGKISSVIQEYLTNQLTVVNNQINEFFASRPLQKAAEKSNEALQDAFQRFTSAIQSN